MEDEFSAQAEGKTIRITVNRGRMDAASAAKFKEAVATAWVEGLTTADVDMSRVEFIDSSGVGALLGVLRRLPQGDGGVVLRAMRPQVLSVIELLRLQKIFRIES